MTGDPVAVRPAAPPQIRQFRHRKQTIGAFLQRGNANLRDRPVNAARSDR
jgi:hypothetical protein